MAKRPAPPADDSGRVVFRELTPVEEARATWYRAFTPRPVGTEDVPLDQALGRIAAADVASNVDVPPFDRSVMDGFAVLASDTFGAQEDAPRRLKVVGHIRAGDEPTASVGTGRAAEIATGAVVPRGANAVVMVEYTRLEGTLVDVFRPVAPGENVFAAGADIMAGETAVRRGTRLTPREVGVLAAIGRRSVTVYRRPRVAVLSTGNEVVAPTEKLRPGKIYDINAHSVAAAVREAGGEPELRGVVPDRAEELEAAISAAHRECDMTIVSGGTSAGAGDLLYRVISNVGKPGILVHGVAVKPGKPTILAVSFAKPILGLPGYPTSALMIFSLFGAPLVRTMAGVPARDAASHTVEASLAETLHAAGGRRAFQPVALAPKRGGGHTAFALPAESGAISTLSEADGFFEVMEDTKQVPAGTAVQVVLFGESLAPADLIITGSHCLGIDFLLDLLAASHPQFRPKVIAVGSTGGISSVARGEADIAGIHLIHPETGEYNTWALRARHLEGKAILVRGYHRQQVLAIRPGGPRRLASLAGLLDGKHRFVNRNPGSGTRALLDAELKEVARERGLSLEEAGAKILGWEVEAKSHSAVATAIATGRADAGVCIETAAVRAGLARIPLAVESFDFLVRSERAFAPPVRAFLDALSSPPFARELSARVPGLTPLVDTGKIVWGQKNPKRGSGESENPERN